jgi:branched-chain amino acid transport system substrate-binding protein
MTGPLSPLLRCALWACCCLPVGTDAAEPIVIGQSLALTGAGFPIANRIQAGAKALVDKVNGLGGVGGRRIELLTLDDAGDPARLATNLRTLVNQRGASLIVNCMGEQACNEAAHTTRDLGVPLVGPLSGAATLRTDAARNVISLRPADAKEAEALSKQLLTLSMTRVTLLSDGTEPLRTAALANAMQKAGFAVVVVNATAKSDSLHKALNEVSAAATQALVFCLGADGLDVLGRLLDTERISLPTMVATTSSAGLTQATRLFRDRVVGYTSVVPNPEVSALPIVQEFSRDADTFVGPEAVTFEGLAAYLHLRLCVEALRRATGKTDANALMTAFEALGALNFGGFTVTYSRTQHHGSDRVDLGLRSRDGRILQ